MQSRRLEISGLEHIYMKISAGSHTYFCPGVGCVLYGLSGGLVVYPSAPKEGEMSSLPSAGVSSPIGDQESTGEERMHI